MDHGHVDDRLSELLIEQDNKAKLPTISEISRIQHGVEQVLKTALDIVQKNDSRLTGTLLPVGSYYSDLKIGLPDEFDFLYELQTFEEDVDFIVRPSGFRGSRDLWRTPSGNPAKRKIQIDMIMMKSIGTWFRHILSKMWFFNYVDMPPVLSGARPLYPLSISLLLLLCIEVYLWEIVETFSSPSRN
ncbi:cyclic GMP-AMP synthase-like isoform X1 [Ostrea edulis]|uniref:cyclic GMP-AMP synthase-like isoform X1 n=1 Tax=Ostrea edulis TaxID=37623 RepID=UPI0024AF6F7A|nr:cyclic GMP-AMP synthase-like isoform X1 [Ostrea edulis]